MTRYFSPRLQMSYLEAYEEVGISKKTIDSSFAIYPKRFYKNVNLKLDKKYDFIFIGALQPDVATYKNRQWIFPFINKHFSNKSYLQFTDANTKRKHIKMGDYDHTLTEKGFIPKEVGAKNRNFFDQKFCDKLSQSNFCLCPAGDVIWTMRFYECLMCKCIPIVEKVDETYRSTEESKIDYKYYLTSEKEFVYREDWVEHNYNLFLKYHTLEFFSIQNDVK